MKLTRDAFCDLRNEAQRALRRSKETPSVLICAGTGCIAGINLLGAGYEPMLISTMAPGGFMIFGLTLGVANIIMKSIEKKKKAKEAA
jgi:hypothetical protein